MDYYLTIPNAGISIDQIGSTTALIYYEIYHYENGSDYEMIIYQNFDEVEVYTIANHRGDIEVNGLEMGVTYQVRIWGDIGFGQQEVISQTIPFTTITPFFNTPAGQATIGGIASIGTLLIASWLYILVNSKKFKQWKMRKSIMKEWKKVD